MDIAKEIIVISFGYVLGCVSTGYYLVRYLRGVDVREHGSGAVGARNTSRVLGPSGFVVTYVGDFLKGMIPVWLALHFEFEPWIVILVIFAATVGHVWPVQLNFRGGKGIATAMGGLLLFDWRLCASFFVLFVVVLLLTREFTLSGLLVAAYAPAVAIAWEYPLIQIFLITALALVVLVAHRSNIRVIVQDMRSSRANR